MSRAIIDKDGPRIAGAGYDAETAPPERMLFDPRLTTFRLLTTGVVTVAEYGSDWYLRHIHTYTVPLPKPPIVRCLGIISSTESDQSQARRRAGTSAAGLQHGWYTVYSFTDRFEIYVAKPLFTDDTPGTPRWGSRTNNWRYYIFDNTLD